MLLFLFPIFASVLAYVTIGFATSVYVKRNDIADVMWGPGIALASWFAYVARPTNIGLLTSIMISLWALRLAYHIGLRFIKKDTEDSRYAQWRTSWHYFYARSYAQVFLLQGFLMVLVALPTIILARYGTTALNNNLIVILIIGLIIWLVGFLFESISDYQLKSFLSARAYGNHSIMTSGLWAYSRHPNYFGEVSLWYGIWIMTIPLLGIYSLIALLGPLTITYLILYVSGIPMTEAHYAGNAEFEEYKKHTNAFFPWFPKK